ncbi:MAG: transposase [Candidatus Vogelbacteria bacterium]|nr:transposase [Candidatus Vogelbacteria bacterium]
MTVDTINIDASIQRVKDLIAAEKDLSSALIASLEVLLLLVTILANRLGFNSKNSSKPPSFDPNRKKDRKEPGERKPGAQYGHVGTTLQPVADPDLIKDLKVDRSTLPAGDYRTVGYERRQVVDLDISTVVTEWRAEILEDQKGKRYVAPFPHGVTRPVQYGVGVKVNAVYMSQFQLIPYNRIEDHFLDQMGVPLSAGTVNNFNTDAFKHLEFFESWVKKELALSLMVHGDETGINIDGIKRWLHSISNDRFTYFYPHLKRGSNPLPSNNMVDLFPRLGFAYLNITGVKDFLRHGAYRRLDNRKNRDPRFLGGLCTLSDCFGWFISADGGGCIP